MTFELSFLSDVNECLVNNGGCRKDKKAYCSNYPGGYYCACETGFILKDNSLTECMGKYLVFIVVRNLHLFMTKVSPSYVKDCCMQGNFSNETWLPRIIMKPYTLDIVSVIETTTRRTTLHFFNFVI